MGLSLAPDQLILFFTTISPLLLGFFLVTISIFNQDIKGLIYLGGVFYSINILPDIWRNISMANPMLYVVNTFREGMLGVSDVSIPFALSMIVLFIVLLSSACLYLLNKGIGIRQ